MSNRLLAVALLLIVGFATPAAAQQIRAGLLTCNVSGGIGFIVGSQKQISCVFAPDQPSWPSRQEDYDGTITKYGLDSGLPAAARWSGRCSPEQWPAQASSQGITWERAAKHPWAWGLARMFWSAAPTGRSLCSPSRWAARSV